MKIKKAKYAWRIHWNHLREEKCNIFGPPNINEKLLALDGERFEMYDDDNELYFKGTLYGDYTGFEPLDDFGRDGYGCTEIWVGGKQV